MPASRPLDVRFIEKVNFDGSLILDTPCWEWTASKDNKGYGRLGGGFGKSPLKASRISWEIMYGEIPKGLFVCHKCDNPSCVNPVHLFLGTHQDNMQDMVNKKRKLKIPDHLRSVKGVNPNIKLTDDQVRLIRCDRRALEDIASDYGVDQSTISLIRRRKRRAGVSD